MPMATKSRREDLTLIERLFQEACRFDFYQAVRLLEWINRDQTQKPGIRKVSPVGRDGPGSQETVRFRSFPAFDFPSGDVVDLVGDSSTKEGGSAGVPPQMQVSFMGLTGPAGTLPQHYTELLLRRIRVKDFALRDFLDLLNHRSLSLFYRAWEKYRVSIQWERARAEQTDNDPFTHSLRCVVGLGGNDLRDLLRVDADVPLYYSGYFAQRPHSTVVLQALLSDYLDIPVKVEPFQGRWLYLEESDQSQLLDPFVSRGKFQQLADDAVLGDRVWDVSSKIRLRFGPLDYEQYERLMPEGDLYLTAGHLVRSYIGTEFDIEFQLIFKDGEYPELRLGDAGTGPSRLGWDAFLGEAESGRDKEAVVFDIDGY